MRDLMVKHGDVTLDERGGVGEVEGKDKIVQDLYHRLSNLPGYNRFHPWLGAGLDGYVGMTPKPDVLQGIREAVRQALDYYVLSQREYVLDAIDIYGDAKVAVQKIGPDGVVKRWEQMRVREEGGSVMVYVRFTTLSGKTGELGMAVDSYAEPAPEIQQYLALEGNFQSGDAL